MYTKIKHQIILASSKPYLKMRDKHNHQLKQFFINEMYQGPSLKHEHTSWNGV